MAVFVTWFDYILVGIICFSFIMGFMKGFIQVLIWIITWCAAITCSVLFANDLTAYFSTFITGYPTLVHWASVLIIFVGVLLLGQLAGMVFGSIALLGRSMSNYLLGGVCGILRGLLLVVIINSIILNTPIANEGWFQNSSIVAYLSVPDAWLAGQLKTIFSQMMNQAMTLGSQAVSSITSGAQGLGSNVSSMLPSNWQLPGK